MFKLIKNNKAVSQVLSFVLNLSITSAVVISASFLTTCYVDGNTESAAQIEAENIADRVINLLVNAYIIADQYPNANYSTSMDIPLKLVNHYSYAIQVNNNGVYVNSTDGRIQITKTYFNTMYSDVNNGYVHGAEGKLTVSIDAVAGTTTVEGGG